MTAVAAPLPAVLTADNTTTTGSTVTEEEEKTVPVKTKKKLKKSKSLTPEEEAAKEAAKEAAHLRHKQVEALKKRVKLLLKESGNKACSECRSGKPKFMSLIQTPLDASTNMLGVFVCDKCKDYHEALGEDLCILKSLKAYEEFTSEDVETLEKSGNQAVNAIYESALKGNHTDKHMGALASSAFVESKYKDCLYFSEQAYHEQMQIRAQMQAEKDGLEEEETKEPTQIDLVKEALQKQKATKQKAAPSKYNFNLERLVDDSTLSTSLEDTSQLEGSSGHNKRQSYTTTTSTNTSKSTSTSHARHKDQHNLQVKSVEERRAERHRKHSTPTENDLHGGSGHDPMEKSHRGRGGALRGSANNSSGGGHSARIGRRSTMAMDGSSLEESSAHNRSLDQSSMHRSSQRRRPRTAGGGGHEEPLSRRASTAGTSNTGAFSVQEDGDDNDADAAIRQLEELGTGRDVLEEMFTPDVVNRVLGPKAPPPAAMMMEDQSAQQRRAMMRRGMSIRRTKSCDGGIIAPNRGGRRPSNNMPGRTSSNEDMVAPLATSHRPQQRIMRGGSTQGGRSTRRLTSVAQAQRQQSIRRIVAPQKEPSSRGMMSASHREPSSRRMMSASNREQSTRRMAASHREQSTRRMTSAPKPRKSTSSSKSASHRIERPNSSSKQSTGIRKSTTGTGRSRSNSNGSSCPSTRGGSGKSNKKPSSSSNKKKSHYGSEENAEFEMSITTWSRVQQQQQQEQQQESRPHSNSKPKKSSLKKKSNYGSKENEQFEMSITTWSRGAQQQQQEPPEHTTPTEDDIAKLVALSKKTTASKSSSKPPKTKVSKKKPKKGYGCIDGGEDDQFEMSITTWSRVQ